MVSAPQRCDVQYLLQQRAAFINIPYRIQLDTEHSHVETYKRWSYHSNRPWRPIGLSDVEASTFSWQSAHGWRWRQLYAPDAIYLQEYSWYSFLLEAESTPGPHSAPGRIRPIEKSNNLVGNRTSNLPACSIIIKIIIWFVRLLALRPLLAYCASLGW
jgi:hypothetical protein